MNRWIYPKVKKEGPMLGKDIAVKTGHALSQYSPFSELDQPWMQILEDTGS